MEKKCTKCGEVKSLDEFGNDKRVKSGRVAACKDCIKKYWKIYLQKNKNEDVYTSQFTKLFHQNHGLRECSKCKLLKTLDNFCIDKKGKHGKAFRCKDCDKKYRKQYYKKYKEFYKNNKQKNSEKYKKYRNKNKEKINRRAREKRKTNTLFKLRCLITSNIAMSIKNQGYTKKTKTYNILKCDYNFFMEWVNGIASNGYTYGVGDLHLDHVVPMSLAQTEDESILLCHYSNYQLLTAKENLLKKDFYVNPTNLKRVLEHHPNPDKIREIHSRL